MIVLVFEGRVVSKTDFKQTQVDSSFPEDKHYQSNSLFAPTATVKLWVQMLSFLLPFELLKPFQMCFTGSCAAALASHPLSIPNAVIDPGAMMILRKRLLFALMADLSEGCQDLQTSHAKKWDLPNDFFYNSLPFASRIPTVPILNHCLIFASFIWLGQNAGR